MDLQRATQAYMDFYPALSVYAIVKSQIRDFKFKSSSDIAVAAGPGWLPSEPFLTIDKNQNNDFYPLLGRVKHIPQ